MVKMRLYFRRRCGILRLRCAIVRLCRRGKETAARKKKILTLKKEGFGEEWELQCTGRKRRFFPHPGKVPCCSDTHSLCIFLQEKEKPMPPKNANMQKITAICERFAAKLEYYLCDVAMEKEPTGRYLRIYIDKDGGITLDDCEKYHRAVQPSLEDYDYDFLEVCSPGIDRPIKNQRDIDASIGLEVAAKLYKPMNGLKTVQGALVKMDDQEVVIRLGEEDVVLPRKSVAQVRLVPDLSALEEDE